MKSFMFFVAGAAAATVVIGRSIQDELPEIITKKIVRGMEKGHLALERKVFGEERPSVRPRARYIRFSTYGRS